MTSPCDIVGLGENSVDLVYGVPDQPGRSAKVMATRCSRLPGGQVATTLCTCAALGLGARYIGVFGSDEHGVLIRGELERRGIDLQYAHTREAPTRHAVILVDDRSGERTVIGYRDPRIALRAGDVAPEALSGARLLHVDNVDEPTAIAAAVQARTAGLIVTTDIDLVGARTPDLVAAATFPILAEHVPQALTGDADHERALRILRQRHDGMLCVTLGSRGAMLLAGDRLHRAPAYPVEVVDTTGAGDVFRGALIYALLRGDAPDAMLRFANAAAAISCTRHGAIGGVPRLEEIERLIRAGAVPVA